MLMSKAVTIQVIGRLRLPGLVGPVCTKYTVIRNIPSSDLHINTKKKWCAWETVFGLWNVLSFVRLSVTIISWHASNPFASTIYPRHLAWTLSSGLERKSRATFWRGHKNPDYLLCSFEVLRFLLWTSSPSSSFPHPHNKKQQTTSCRQSVGPSRSNNFPANLLSDQCPTGTIQILRSAWSPILRELAVLRKQADVDVSNHIKSKCHDAKTVPHRSYSTFSTSN
jgi:hypothetical protein